MENQLTHSGDCFRFHKVDEFYADDFSQWDHIESVTNSSFDFSTRILTLTVTTTAGDNPSALLLQIPRYDTLRVRFNPEHTSAVEYPQGSPRSQANAIAVAAAVAPLERVTRSPSTLTESSDPERVEYTRHEDRAVLTTYHEGTAQLRVAVSFGEFRIRVWRVLGEEGDRLVMADAVPAIRFRENVSARGESFGYSIMATKTKPNSSLYAGFGEHGSCRLFSDRIQHNFFNYDNYGYRKVYGKGAGDEREPLYHSAPFFLELNGAPGTALACGIFVDNTSQTLMDIGVTDERQVKFASTFGELDYYMFVGDTAAEVVNGYGMMVNHTWLKPRWSLGYHQGCYGYESRDTVEYVARQYRRYGIPIDGLHIDVDIQRQYQTFTIDENAFPNPKEMFSQLRAHGFKCATNITPIISDRDEGWPVFAEANRNKYFIADSRCSAAGREAEVYQDYSEGALCADLYESQNVPSNYDTGNRFIGEVYYGGGRGTTGSYPDLGRQEVREWWGRQYQPLFDTGLEMIWQDMTTPAIRNCRGDMCGLPFKVKIFDDSEGIAEDQDPRPVIAAWNLYSYNLHKATYLGLNALRGRENLRNFVVGRGGFAGMARHAALWTGDNRSSWGFLQLSIPQILAIGLCAQPMSGSDVGGFEAAKDGDQWADPALVIRWTAASAFFPWFRNHYIRKGRKQFQEPWAYHELDPSRYPQGDRDIYRSVLPICRYYIGLRYRMLQMFYDAMFANTLTSQPICRPLFLEHPQDTSLLFERREFQSTEFMVGDDLLVAPVVQPENECHGRRDVYLPSGTEWYNFMDNRMPLPPAAAGGSVVSFNASIGSDDDHLPFIVPLYVRAGAVIPMTELEQYVGQRHEAGEMLPITYTIYPGPEGSHTSYIDDGVSRSSAPRPVQANDDDPAGKGEYRAVTVSHRFERMQRIIDVVRDHDGYDPPESFFYIALLHSPDDHLSDGEPVWAVRLGGEKLPKIVDGSTDQRDEALRAASSNAWYYNDAIRATFVKVFDTDPRIQLVASCGAD